ncbi:hypothetical protein A5791_08825 [Mycobacterium sp. 852002-51163_SCH5372311]|uniref:DUF2249 domain-containing protein n=1 Tax=Mycobacterium sp. 852002-51163_SCH5372311 TaxID=1834097 RepID=UPI0007FDA207|nr:DUF2249 domain-containing protein [Mycobacterium sp. 852002-51163_SCH5372311]OBF80228.1 hypothetical protein A5791_08825 [Mycobacterium sp. 852002-51163_SCH5372311]
MAQNELDVRQLRKPDKHPTIFATYSALPVGESFVLVNNHDPRHLRDEFDADHPGSYGWEYLDKGPEVWRIRITKLASTPLPRIVADTHDFRAEPDATGAVWKLQARDRDLDSNIIALPPAGSIDAHSGPDLDVLIHVLSGNGTLTTEMSTIDLFPGALVWLPRGSRRQFDAGPDGLRYLTVHHRRQALVLEPAKPQARQAV